MQFCHTAAVVVAVDSGHQKTGYQCCACELQQFADEATFGTLETCELLDLCLLLCRNPAGIELPVDFCPSDDPFRSRLSACQHYTSAVELRVLL